MLQLFEYQLPFRNSFQTGSSTFKNRKGVLLHYQEEDTDFVVEASPLPGFSRESIFEVKQILLDQKKFIEDFLSGELSLQKVRNLAKIKVLDLPSIQFSLSFLGLSILAYRQSKSIYDLLDKRPSKRILINDVIGYGSIEQMKNQLESSIENDFKTIKIKAPHPVDDLAELLSSIHKKHPNIQFRIDANRSWPKSKVKQNSKKLQHLPVEYIEEPCKINNLSEIKEIQKISSLPVALDESVSTIKELEEVAEKYSNLVLVIKPMLLGNFLEIHETISCFRSSSKQIVVTTTLESKIGRSTMASAASLIGDQQMGHGLHTGHLFADDLLPDFKIKNGSITNLQENPAIQSLSQIKTSYLKNLG